ncbi:MAG: triose-phosphate isomerase [Planctomycetota bacterium]|jgi:triosephosphate isomerase
MTTRRPLVGGNWKMHTLRAEAKALAEGVVSRGGEFERAEVVCFVPYVWTCDVAGIVGGSSIACGVQDVSERGQGAYTGEVSCDMVLDAGATWALTGHSERRHVIGESDELVGAKTAGALRAGLRCCLCVGELLEEREAGKTDEVNRRQLRAGLEGLGKDELANLALAYEPGWAIGTGKTATPEDAQNAHRAIRAELAAMYDEELASGVRIMYGGSVKPGNAGELFAMEDIDGGLIGGASLDVESFVSICAAAQGSVAQESVGG